MATHPTIKVAHTSDQHLGYEAYRAVTASGHNQRGTDLVAAFVNVVRDIVAWDPPLVVLPGDVTDRPSVAIKYMAQVRALLVELAGIRPDGTRRQVVISSGNHDQPHALGDLNFLELFSGTPGVHVVTDEYQVVEFDGTGVSAGADPVLADVSVHTLPHDQLKRVGWDQVRPIEGRVNILAAHGVAGGSELYVRSLGREFAIPTDVLGRQWEYGALGHWHKRTRVNDRVWYCGSPENVSFRDLRDGGQERGYLRVHVEKGQTPKVEQVNLPIRKMIKLPEFDASHLDADEITSKLVAQVRAQTPRSAIVAQIVTGVSRDRWALVDRAQIRDAGAAALHFDLVARYARAERADHEIGSSGLADVDDLLAARATELLGAADDPAVTLASKLVAEQVGDGLSRPGTGTEDDTGTDTENSPDTEDGTDAGTADVVDDAPASAADGGADEAADSDLTVAPQPVKDAA